MKSGAAYRQFVDNFLNETGIGGTAYQLGEGLHWGNRSQFSRSTSSRMSLVQVKIFFK